MGSLSARTLQARRSTCAVLAEPLVNQTDCARKTLRHTTEEAVLIGMDLTVHPHANVNLLSDWKDFH